MDAPVKKILLIVGETRLAPLSPSPLDYLPRAAHIPTPPRHPTTPPQRWRPRPSPPWTSWG